MYINSSQPRRQTSEYKNAEWELLVAIKYFCLTPCILALIDLLVTQDRAYFAEKGRRLLDSPHSFM